MIEKKPFENCYWIVPGRFLAGEYPGHPEEGQARERLVALAGAGVGCLVDLTAPADGMAPYDHLLDGAGGKGLRRLSFPVDDVSVPCSEAYANAILDAIDDAVAGGEGVYLHCVGGVGRTGTLAGCWLARHGHRGPDALARLRRLYADCPKSARRPSPETREQELYILEWRDGAADPAVSRTLGALLGLAAGDAVGTTLEFEAPGSFTPQTGMTGGGHHNLLPGQWTDDTSLALCLAESLLGGRGFDPRDQLERYVRWWREGYLSSTGKFFDIGTATRASLKRFLQTGEVWAGSTDPREAGNGSLMRLAPVPLFFAGKPEKAVHLSGESSRTTHGARTCVDACRYLGGLIVGAVNGESKETLLSERYAPVPGLWDREPLCPEVDLVARGSFKRREPPEIRGSGYVVESLEAALWAFHRTGSFREGCLAAVNLGDDADTTGAVYGQLAGAYYGAENIPAEWRERLAMRELIHTYALGLARPRRN